jgi:hypothetical protein
MSEAIQFLHQKPAAGRLIRHLKKLTRKERRNTSEESQGSAVRAEGKFFHNDWNAFKSEKSLDAWSVETFRLI